VCWLVVVVEWGGDGIEFLHSDVTALSTNQLRGFPALHRSALIKARVPKRPQFKKHSCVLGIVPWKTGDRRPERSTLPFHQSTRNQLACSFFFHFALFSSSSFSSADIARHTARAHPRGRETAVRKDHRALQIGFTHRSGRESFSQINSGTLKSI